MKLSVATEGCSDYLACKAVSVLPAFIFTSCGALMQRDVSQSSHLLLQGYPTPTLLAKMIWSSFTSGEMSDITH